MSEKRVVAVEAGGDDAGETSFRPLTLVPFEIAQSSRLTKTLYIRLELNAELTALADMLKRRAHQPSSSTLDSCAGSAAGVANSLRDAAGSREKADSSFVNT